MLVYVPGVAHTYLVRVKKSRRRHISSTGKSKRKCWYTYQVRIYVVPGIIPFCSSTRRRCEPFQQREVIASVVHTYLIRVKKSRRRYMSSNGKSKRKCWYTYQPSDEEHPSPCEAAGCVGTADTSSTEIQLFTHHDIVKQYRKGLTAVVDSVAKSLL